MIQDFVTHLEYLQFVLLKFNDDSLDKSYLIWFFRNGLRPLIKVQIKNSNKKLHDWEDLMQKTIKTKSKTSFLPPLILQEIDQQVTHSKQPIENTKASI